MKLAVLNCQRTKNITKNERGHAKNILTTIYDFTSGRPVTSFLSFLCLQIIFWEEQQVKTNQYVLLLSFERPKL